MTDISQSILPPPTTITTLSMSSAGNIQYGLVANSTALTSGTTVANACYFVPFILNTVTTFTKLFVANGTVVSGNIDVGIYDTAGTKLVSSGSTAQAGTSTLQIIDITDITLGPGIFYFAVVIDNATGTFYRLATTASIECKLAGKYVQASTFPLPATATFSATGNQNLTLVGASTVVTL